jgi:hypothetical protein
VDVNPWRSYPTGSIKDRMAKAVISRAEAIPLMIEYDPQPPFDSGSPGKASESVIALMKRMLGL